MTSYVYPRLSDAHALARDALLAALGGLEKLRRDIPEPSKPRQRPVVVVPILQSAKLALYQAMRNAGLNKVTLASKLGKAENEVRRMLDLDHASRIGALEDALRLLGRQMAVDVKVAA